MEGYEAVLPREKEIWLLKRIDELKHEVDCAEAETARVERRLEEWQNLARRLDSLRNILLREYPDIAEAVRVIERLEKT